MTTARPRRPALRRAPVLVPALALVLVLVGTLAACGSDPAGDASPPPDLQSALTLDVKGFEPAAAPQPPATVCREGQYSEGPVPELPGSLGDPTSAGYRSDEAELHAWAWRTASAETAAAVVDDAVADLEACSYEVFFDSDTDGDGRIDAGGSEQQHARAWSDENWTGMTISGSSYGNGAEITEARFARRGDVVVLVVLTVHGNDDALRPVLISFLDGVADRLG
jgi:hypothetical protein